MPWSPYEEPMPDALTFRDLEVLLAFSSTEHLGRTADQLACSAASVQRALRSMEAKLGVVLVERDGRRLRLRRAGWVLAEQAARVLRSRSDAVDTVRAVGSANEVPLRIGHTFSLGVCTVPEIVARFVRGSAAMRVVLRQGPATTMVSSLLSGEIDAAFTSISPVEPDIRVVPLFHEAALLAVPAHEAPEHGGRPVPLRAVRERPFVAMRDGANSRGFLTAACARAGFSPRVVVDTDDLFSVAGLVAAGLGVSVLPARMTDYHHPGLALLPLAEEVPTRRTISLAYRPGGVRDEALRALSASAQRYVTRPSNVAPGVTM